MTHHADPKEIEAEIERERASLASTIGALQNRVSVDHLARDALGMIRTNAADYARSVDQAIRANPMAIALTGVGIAWLVFGGRKSGGGDDGPDYRVAGPRDFEAQWSFDEDEWSHEADGLRQRASDTLRQIEDDARAYQADLRAGLADRYAEARDYAAERAAVLADFTADLKRSFARGLDDLSETARETIVAARERAYAARLRAERMMREGRDGMVQAIEDHPLIAGAVALGLGAAVATALPRSRTEDRAFGSQSDRLMSEAARLLRAERARALRIAEGVGEEIRSGVKETVSAASEKARETAERAKQRASEEAEAEAPGDSVASTAAASRSRTAAQGAGKKTG